jgi:hypothetical protein
MYSANQKEESTPERNDIDHTYEELQATGVGTNGILEC